MNNENALSDSIEAISSKVKLYEYALKDIKNLVAQYDFGVPTGELTAILHKVGIN